MPDFSKRPLVENSRAMRISNFVRTGYQEIKYSENEKVKSVLDLTKESDVKKFIALTERYAKITVSDKDQHGEDKMITTSVRLTYSPSNLGKGFIFWFLCNGCTKRTRILYTPLYTSTPLCRKCHRLAYKSQSYDDRPLLNSLRKLY